MTPITVTGTYRKADGSSASGQVSFTLTANLHDADGDLIATRTPTVAELDGDGSFSVELYATDGGVQPEGVAYRVTERISGAPRHVWDAQIPYDSPAATIDLADVAPATTSASYTYSLLGHVHEDGGIADGSITEAKLSFDPATQDELDGVSTTLSAETVARVAQDNVLQGNIDTEATVRAAADSGLQDSIDAHLLDHPAAGNYVESADVATIDRVTQAEYDALTPDADTLYIVIG